MKSFAMIRFHTLGPWLVLSLGVAVLDMLMPQWVGLSVLQVAIQLAAFRRLAARRVVSLTVVLMLATIFPGLIRLLLGIDTVSTDGMIVPGHWFAPVRGWTVLALGVAMLLHGDQQHIRKRRLLLRQKLQRKVRRRSTQVQRINEALRREVARRQATQQRLSRTESHLQSLAARMQLQVLRKDSDGVITYANDAFCRGVGKNVDEVIGSTDADLYPASTAQKYRQDDAQVMASGVPVDHVESHPTADGQTGWVQVFKAPDYDENNDCIGIQMVFWDVTDTYRRTAELRRSEARKRALFDAAREAVLLIDDQGRIVEANPSAESILGGRPLSLPGCLLESVATPESAIGPPSEDDQTSDLASVNGSNSRAWIERAELRWQDLPTSERREMTVRRQDGTRFPAEITVHPIPLENSQGLAVFVRDVTLRHRAIRALRDAKQAAEEASRTKSEFMASVSHEIRTPLGGITGSAELLASMELPPRANQYVSMIRQSADLLSGVIGDILDFASIEAGRLQLDPMPIDLHQCVGEAFRCLATRGVGKDIELVLSVAPNVPKTVLADPQRLRQIVMNLAGNAIKFTPRGHVQLRLTMPANLVVIEVMDSGVGIAKDLQQKIFEPFEQGDSGTTRRFGGTGLGLSISDQLVRQMGGRIEVDSRSGHGSTFRVLLPLPVTAPTPTVLRHIDEANTIAVEIRHPVQRAAITDFLVASGYQVDRRAKLRIIDQTPDMRPTFSHGKKFGFSVADDDHVVWLARVDDPPLSIARPEQPVLFKPILPEELLRAIDQALATTNSATPSLLSVASRPLEPIQQPGVTKRRLLVVDDSEVNRTVIHDFLYNAGYQADVVAGGAAAIVATGTTSYDCILMDLQMPELDGVETMQLIVRQCQHRGVEAPPVIALTAHATDEHQTRCLNAGMKSFLVKPIDPTLLIDAVDSLLGNIPDLPTSPAAFMPANHEQPVEDWQVKLLASAGGDRGTMVALAHAFVTEVPQLCRSLQSALDAGNEREARRAAHTLKSCLKYVAPQVDWQVALEIENATQVHDLECAKHLAPQAIQLGQHWTARVNELL